MESLILARYYMFTQVYFHGVRRAYDLVLTELIAEVLERETGERYYPPTDRLNDYLNWDDHRVLEGARVLKDASSHNPAWRILTRNHPKTVYETMPHAEPTTIRGAERLFTQASEAFPDVRFWKDRASDHPEQFKEEGIFIRKGGASEPQWKSLTKESKALLGLDQVTLVRLYADVRGNRASENEIIKFCKQRMGDLA